MNSPRLHPVPKAALEADIATIAQKGAGKTYANRGLVERLLDQRRRVVVLDPLNSWWGLKALANGKPGYAVAVVGGPNADIPLDPEKGEQLGDFIAGGDLSVVIDVSELRRGEMIRFSAAFLAALYRTNRDPLWLVLEEADVFAPQQPMNDATRLLHEVDQIARRGRARGFRLWTITQRPAKLHKDVLTQTSTLIMLRLRSPQDRAAAEAWIYGNAESATAKDIVATLASLPVGEGWVWSPDHDLLERVRFPPIKTLDTSATPEAGAPRPAVGKLATADLDALRAAIVAPKADVVASAEHVPADIEKTRQAGYLQGYDVGHEKGFVAGVEHAARHFTVSVEQLAKDVATIKTAAAPASTPQAVMSPQEVAPTSAPKPNTSPPLKGSGAGADRLLKVLVAAPDRPLTWSEVAILAVMSPTAGYTRAAINKLREDDKVVEGGAGVRAAQPGGAQPLNAAEITDAWAEKLGGAAARILRHLFVLGPQTQDQVADGIGLSPTAGYTRAGWKKLRSNGLVVQVDANAWNIAPVIQHLKTRSS